MLKSYVQNCTREREREKEREKGRIERIMLFIG